VTDPYLGEIRMFGGTFAPVGWALCNGQLLPIAGNDALWTLFGTTYGGDGQTTFGLPNLQGRLPVHQGPGFGLGSAGGTETVTLTTSQLPLHSHTFQGSANTGTQSTPPGNVPATIAAGSAYAQDPATAALAAPSIQPDSGGGQAHSNMQPYQCVTFIVCLEGIYPTPT
jgi:microcystin-dependent protein